MDVLASYLPTAALASSTVLACGCLAASLIRSPAHRQRTEELFVAIAIVAGLQAFLPIDRMSISAPTPDASQLRPGHRPSLATDILLSTVSTVGIPASALPVPKQQPDRSDSDARASSLLPALFFVGAAASLLHAMLGWALLQRRWAASVPAPSQLGERASNLVDHPVEVRIQSGSTGPYCWGLSRLRIMLPTTLLLPGAEDQLQAVLLHEAAHLRRRDPRSRILLSLATPWLYWNPLHWWLARDSCHCAELLADDAAACSLGKRHYANALLALAEHTFATRSRSARPGTASPTLRHPSDLNKRLHMLFQRNTTLRPNSSRPQRILRRSLAVLALGTVSVAWGRVPTARISPMQSPDAKEQLTSYRVVVSAPSLERVGLCLSHLTANAGPRSSINQLAVQALPDGTQELSFVLAAPAGLALGTLADCIESSGVSGQSIRAQVPLKAQLPPPAPLADFQLTAQNIDILDLITEFARKGRANIVVDRGVEGNLTVAFDGVPWRRALASSVRSLGFEVTKEAGGILRIHTTDPAGD